MGEQVKNTLNPFSHGNAMQELMENDTLKDFAHIFEDEFPGHPKLQQMIAGSMLIGWMLGVSSGRWEAIENPSKALQDETATLRNVGVTDSDLEELASATKELRAQGAGETGEQAKK